MSSHSVFSGSISELAFIADVDEIGARVYLSEDGLPVIMFENMPSDLDAINLPEFWRLDELCSERTFSEEGQAYLITDILVRRGFCTYANGFRMRAVIRSNLEQKNFKVVVQNSVS